MKHLFAASSLAILLAAAPAFAAETTSAKDFIQKAQAGNMVEIELGQMAASQAQSQGVKDFAQRIVTDHTKARDQLANLAQKENVTISGKMNEADQKRVDQLKSDKGTQFDQAFLNDMVRDHQKDVQLYQQAQNGISNSDVKAYIDQTLPTLQTHLQMAQKLQQPEAAAAGSSGSSTGQSRSQSR
jgi:putative membrane protein